MESKRHDDGLCVTRAWPCGGRRSGLRRPRGRIDGTTARRVWCNTPLGRRAPGRRRGGVCRSPPPRTHPPSRRKSTGPVKLFRFFFLASGRVFFSLLLPVGQPITSKRRAVLPKQFLSRGGITFSYVTQFFFFP